MADTVIQTVPLGFQWPTIDPFLFCVHHDDAYPPGNDVARAGGVARRAATSARTSRASTAGGCTTAATVPGFPNHPHRGFETVTYVRQGLIDHSDSLGAAARFGRGDVQWLTAGERHRALRDVPAARRGPSRTRSSCSRSGSTCPPRTSSSSRTSPCSGTATSRARHVDDDGRSPRSRSSPARLAGLTPPPPPPHSWASRPDADVAIWHLRLEPGAPLDAAARPRAPTRSAPCTSSRAAALVIDGTEVGHEHRRRCVRGGRGHRAREPGRAPRCCCSRAGRSASRWPATARSS